MNSLELWDKVKQPPPTALRTIEAGRLKGKSDINPQWRYQVMTEHFGMCGVGWKYDVEVWNEPAPDGQVFAFAKVNLSVLCAGEWSEPIPGIGGSMLVSKEQAGLHASDEGYKMAITDALSVAMKMLGVGANIYLGLSDSKYQPKKDERKRVETGLITHDQIKALVKAQVENGYEPHQVTAIIVSEYKKASSKELTSKEADELIGKLNRREHKS